MPERYCGDLDPVGWATSMYFNKTFHATGTISLCDRFFLSRLVFKSLKKQLRE